jgi:lysophospholipase L1-like esterase
VRIRRLLGAAALTIAATLVSVIAAELVLALALPDSNLRTTAGLNIFTSDSALGYRLQPNLYRRFPWLGREIVIVTNGQGHRIPEAERHDMVTSAKLLIAGDSYVFGNEVMAEETFTHLLGDALQLKTANLGVGGYSIGQSARALSRVLATMADSSARAFLVFYIGNDLEWGAAPRIPKVDLNGFLIDTPGEATSLADQLRLWLALNSRLAFYGGKVMSSWRRDRSAPSTPDTTVAAAPTPQSSPRGRWIYEERRYTAAALAGHRSVFEMVRRTSQQSGVPITVVLLPERDQVEGRTSDLPNRKLTALLSEIGIPSIDLLPAMRDAFLASGKPQYHEARFGHLSPEGHRVVAARLAEQGTKRLQDRK